MKKYFCFIYIGLFCFLLGCTDSINNSIYVGYTLGAGDAIDFSAFLAFSIDNPVGENEEGVDIFFEYGHAYSEDQYEMWDSIYTLTVFVSNSTNNHDRTNDEYLTLYEEKLDNFVSSEYKCDVDLSKIFSKIEYKKSFSLSIHSEDISYDMGMLYFVLYQGDISEVIVNNLPRVYQVIYFTNFDGVLRFTNENPF